MRFQLARLARLAFGPHASWFDMAVLGVVLVLVGAVLVFAVVGRPH